MNIIEKIHLINNQTTDKDLSIHLQIPSETITYFDLIIKELSNSKKIKKQLKVIYKNEKPGIKKTFIGTIFNLHSKKDIFLEKYFLARRYNSIFQNKLLKWKYNCNEDTLLNLYYLCTINHKTKENKLFKYIRMYKETIPYFQDYLNLEQYSRLIKTKNISLLSEYINYCRNDRFYNLLAIKILELKLEDQILLINQLTFDTKKLYFALINQTNEFSFVKFSELLMIIYINDADKLLILMAWLRIFIKKQMFSEFISLYNFLRYFDFEEIKIYEAFNKTILLLKKEEETDFDEFVQMCEEIKDENYFATITLKELAEEYKFKE